ncbi:hypothetical protein HDV00_008424 [Rhizophlyctis rosea]|nr:hypothetical protein HDV00_008424 [Rhizophlyctis rosea]
MLQHQSQAARQCQGYKVSCKNTAVKGRLFCFTCAGRKSRTKKTETLEKCMTECALLKKRLTQMEAELQTWQRTAISLRMAEYEAQKELLRIKTEYRIPVNTRAWQFEEALIEGGSPPQQSGQLSPVAGGLGGAPDGLLDMDATARMPAEYTLGGKMPEFAKLMVSADGHGHLGPATPHSHHAQLHQQHALAHQQLHHGHTHSHPQSHAQGHSGGSGVGVGMVGMVGDPSDHASGSGSIFL